MIWRSRLGIPMYGADPRLVALGTKTGCRRLFAEEGVRHPIGVEDLHSIDDARRRAIIRMREDRPTCRQVIVKLNEGVSGRGQRRWWISAGLPAPGDTGRAGRGRRNGCG